MKQDIQNAAERDAAWASYLAGIHAFEERMAARQARRSDAEQNQAPCAVLSMHNGNQRALT